MAMRRTGVERRKYERLPLSIPIFVRGADQEGKEFLEFATALNISSGGVLLATRRSLPRAGNLLLEIPVVPMPPNVVAAKSVRSLTARLVWVTHGERCHLLGLKFVHPLHTMRKRKAVSSQ